ncbi:MAG: hypothetical protein B1H03_00600 [Planctomycetales bacterium 4484_113]|nr:MAG: hypothetical protein B1H03_00600 [Planctomycetales bacterium 4484_113]
MSTKEKYLVAAKGSGLDAKVSPRFGHAPYYLIVEPETMEFRALPGVGEDEASPPVAQFATEGLTTVITANIGPGAYADIQASGLRAYICRGMTVREAVEKVRSGEIVPAAEPTMERSIQEMESERDAAKGEPATPKEHPPEREPPQSGEGRGLGLGPGLGRGGGMGLGRGAGGRGRGLGPGGGRGRGAGGRGRGLGPGGGRGLGGGRRG